MLDRAVAIYGLSAMPQFRAPATFKQIAATRLAAEAAAPACSCDDNWIDQLYVDSDITGAGDGWMLMRSPSACHRRACSCGHPPANVGAQSFYSRYGFVEVQRSDGAANEEHAPDNPGNMTGARS
jgi:ribosomal protein S18 acetylase RimI-like enzyme